MSFIIDRVAQQARLGFVMRPACVGARRSAMLLNLEASCAARTISADDATCGGACGSRAGALR